MNQNDVTEKVTDKSSSTDAESTSGLRLVVRRVRVSTGAKAGSEVAPSPDGTGGYGHKVW